MPTMRAAITRMANGAPAAPRHDSQCYGDDQHHGVTDDHDLSGSEPIADGTAEQEQNRPRQRDRRQNPSGCQAAVSRSRPPQCEVQSGVAKLRHQSTAQPDVKNAGKHGLPRCTGRCCHHESPPVLHVRDGHSGRRKPSTACSTSAANTKSHQSYPRRADSITAKKGPGSAGSPTGTVMLSLPSTLAGIVNGANSACAATAATGSERRSSPIASFGRERPGPSSTSTRLCAARARAASSNASSPDSSAGTTAAPSRSSSLVTPADRSRVLQGPAVARHMRPMP